MGVKLHSSANDYNLLKISIFANMQHKLLHIAMRHCSIAQM